MKTPERAELFAHFTFCAAFIGPAALAYLVATYPLNAIATVAHMIALDELVGTMPGGLPVPASLQELEKAVREAHALEVQRLARIIQEVKDKIGGTDEETPTPQQQRH